MGIWYCTREDVKSALDFKETARNNGQIDRAIEAASRSIESFLHRKFYPLVATRYFDWPNFESRRSWKLYLDEHELVSVTSFFSGTTSISSSLYNLEPANDGPPYNRIELKLSGNASFGLSSSYQRDITITGVWGYLGAESLVSTIAEALDDSETAVDVNNSVIGVGDIIKVDSERMVVIGKSMLDTGQNLVADMAAQNNVVTVGVADGTTFAVGEIILIDSERMLIVDIAGNNLTVKRGWDGSVLATHTATADIYAPRTLTVERGALGTTATTHLASTSVYLHKVPGLIKQLCIAEALNSVLQETSGYARVVGAGETQREMSGKALKDIRDQAYTAHARKVRTGAI